LGEEEEKEVEVSNSLMLGSGGATKGSEEMTHISSSITIGCVDFTQDQLPDMVERAPSPMTMSSPIKVSPKEMCTSNPSVL